MVTFWRYLKQPSVCQPQIDTVMILQMDELKPERSGRRSGLDWDTRGMTSALLPALQDFWNSKVTWLNQTVSQTFI